MTEEKTKKEIEKEEKLSLIEQANFAADRLAQQNAELKSLLDRQEELRVKETLSGKSEVAPPVQKEESPEEYAKRVLKDGFKE